MALCPRSRELFHNRSKAGMKRQKCHSRPAHSGRMVTNPEAGMKASLTSEP
jgi:hypothetical protein